MPLTAALPTARLAFSRVSFVVSTGPFSYRGVEAMDRTPIALGEDIATRDFATKRHL